MADALVRAAVAGDGLAIAWVQREVWLTAFAGVLPQAVLDTAAADLATSWTSAFGVAGQSILVALEGATVVGFTQIVLSGQTETDRHGVAEIKVLYVRPAWARRGHGGRLLAAAAAAAREHDAAQGEWWIPETDTATQNFARSVGWQSAGGARVLDTGRAMITERRWTGALDFELSGAS